MVLVVVHDEEQDHVTLPLPLLLTPATPAHHIFHLLLVCMSYLQTATLELLPPLPLLPLLPLGQRRFVTVPVPVVFVVTEINLDSQEENHLRLYPDQDRPL